MDKNINTSVCEETRRNEEKVKSLLARAFNMTIQTKNDKLNYFLAFTRGLQVYNNNKITTNHTAGVMVALDAT